MPTSQTPPAPASQPPAAGSSSFATKLLAVLLVLLIIVIGYILLRPAPKTTTGPSTSTSTVAPAAVSISAAGFSPATVSIRKGQAVTWTNTDNNPHGVTSSATGAASFKSSSLAQNDTYSYIFSTSGTYTYHDSLNPTTLSGTVVVK